jgi:hypothetical protein
MHALAASAVGVAEPRNELERLGKEAVRRAYLGTDADFSSTSRRCSATAASWCPTPASLQKDRMFAHD